MNGWMGGWINIAFSILLYCSYFVVNKEMKERNNYDNLGKLPNVT